MIRLVLVNYSIATSQPSSIESEALVIWSLSETTLLLGELTSCVFVKFKPLMITLELSRWGEKTRVDELTSHLRKKNSPGRRDNSLHINT